MASEKIKVLRLAHVHYQHPDLTKATSFLEDFGLIECDKALSRIYYRGFGVQPYVYVADQSPDSQRHFLGGAWVVESARDLQIAASHPGSSGIMPNAGPGGGKVVTIVDPNGFGVSFVHGQTLRSDKPEDLSYFREETPGITSNTALQKPRKGNTRRFQQGVSLVAKLGHYGYIVPGENYQRTMDWYTSIMNLKPTDAVYDPETGEEETCFNHIDLGETFTDHHSFFVGRSRDGKKAHVHHSSFEVNDFDTQSLGHDWLRRHGWTNCWGIGRHVLGSQIFDYWFDASGNIVEHYSDGDLVNCHTPFGREAAAPNSLYIWGPNIPLGFVTGRIEDAGKQLVVVQAKKEPDAFASQPATLDEALIAT